MGSQILKHYHQEQHFDAMFSAGFKDALIMGEEIYQCDIVQDEPVLTKLNPLKVYTTMSGNSDRIEDASLIIVEDHWSPNKIVDHFHDELKPADIDYIIDYDSTGTGSGSYSEDDQNHTLLRDGAYTGNSTYDAMFQIAEINGHTFGL
jgi:hypothetical protein